MFISSPRSYATSTCRRIKSLHCITYVLVFILTLSSFSVATAQSEYVVVGDHLKDIAINEGLLPGDINDFEILSHHESSTSKIHHYYFVQNSSEINIWRTNSSYHELDNKMFSYESAFLSGVASLEKDPVNPDMDAYTAC